MNTRTQIPAEVSNFYDRTLLDRVMPLLVFSRFAQVRDIPRNAGTNVIKFRRYSSLAPATTPLTEGVTPVGSQVSVTDITATVRQYGDFLAYSDVLTYETEDPVLMEFAELLGDQAAQTTDELIRDILAANTGKVYSGTSNVQTSDVAAGDVIALADIDTAVTVLKGNNARKITRQIDASSGYATSPIRACFVGIVHQDILSKIRSLAEAAGKWIPVEKYASQTTVMEGEVGTYGDVRFIETNGAKIKTGAGTSNIDVYVTQILAANAYGVSHIGGETLQNIVKPLGSGGTEDPLNQRGTSGWKMTLVAKILNEDFVESIESAKV